MKLRFIYNKQKNDLGFYSRLIPKNKVSLEKIAFPFLTESTFQPTNTYLFKVKNRNTRKMCKICSKITKNSRTTPMTWFCFCSCSLWTYFKPLSRVSIVDFEQINIGWTHVVALIEVNIQNMAEHMYWSDEICWCSIF